MKLRLILLALLSLLVMNACITSNPNGKLTEGNIFATLQAVSENSNKYMVTGSINEGFTGLTYSLNGADAKDVTLQSVQGKKTFSFEVALNQGENILKLIANAGSNRTVTKTLKPNYNPQSLVLNVVEPNATTDSANSTIRGFVGNTVTKLSYSLNGATATDATIAADKSFALEVVLNEGPNTIAISADDANPITDTVTKTVSINFVPIGKSMFRILHASPDAGNVNVLVDGKAMFSDVALGTLSDYMVITEGTHRIEVNPAGSVTTVIEKELEFVAANSYTFLIEGTVDSQDDAALEGKFLMDNLAPKDQVAQTRIVHAAAKAGQVDAYITAPDAALDSAQPLSLAYGEDTVVESQPGNYRIRVTPKGLQRVIYDTGVIALAAGSVQTVIATDAAPVQLNILSPNGMAALPNVAEQSHGRISGYVVNRRGGTPVAGAAVSIPTMGELTKTDANGYYEISVPAGYHTVMFSKEGSAGSKVDGLRVETGKMTRYNTLQVEAFDPYMTTIPPQVTTNVTHGQTFTGDAENDTFEIELEGTLSQPEANKFYRTIVGIAATAGDSGYLSKYVPRTILTFDGSRSPHTLSAAGFDGETTLHVVVYDQNTNRTEIIRYVTINSKSTGAAPVAPTKVFAKAVTIADVAELGTLSIVPRADVFINALQYDDADAMQELAEAAAQANQLNAHTSQGLQTQGYLDEAISWVDITFEYSNAELPTAFEVFRQFENDPEPMLIGRIAAAKAQVEGEKFAFRDSTPGLQSGQKITYTIDAVSGGQRASAAEGSETKVLPSFEIKIVSPEDGKTFTSVRPVYTMTYTNAADNVVAGVIALDRVQSDSFFVMGNRRFNLTQDATLQRFGGYINKTGAAIPHRVLELLGGRPLAAHHTYDWQPVAMTTTVDDKGTEDTDDDVVTAISVGADFYNLFGAVDLPRFGIKEVPASTFTTGNGTF